jgi:hypothetical protein
MPHKTAKIGDYALTKLVDFYLHTGNINCMILVNYWKKKEGHFMCFLEHYY